MANTRQHRRGATQPPNGQPDMGGDASEAQLGDSRREKINDLLQQRADTPEALDKVGNQLLALKAYKEAEPYFSEALEPLPDHPGRLAALAIALHGQRKLAEAIPTARRALALEPDRLDLQMMLATALLESAQLEEAQAIIAEITDRAEHDSSITTTLLLNLSRHTSLSQPLQRRLLAVTESAKAKPADKANAHLMLGKERLSDGKLEEAFAHYRQANRIRYAITEETGVPWRRALGHIQSVYTRELFEKFSSVATDTIPEVFIVGPSRSGKSLVEQILAQHPHIRKGGERPDFYNQVCDAAEAYSSINELVDALTEDDLPELRSSYLSRLNYQHDVVTNTHPDNYFVLGMLGILFPKVPIIFCMRNLLDLGVASYFKDYDIGHRHTYDLGELGRYIANYEKALQHWASVLPNPILMVEYTELVENPDEVAQNLYSALGLGTYQPDREFQQRASQQLQHLGPAHSVDIPTLIHSDFDGLGAKFREALEPLVESYQAAAAEAPPVLMLKQQRLMSLYHGINALQQAGSRHAMVGLASRLVELDPGQPEALTLLGTSLSLTGKSDRGIEAIQEARSLAPDDANIRIQEAEALIRASRWTEAHRALERWPNRQDRYYHLKLLAFVGRRHSALDEGSLERPSEAECAMAHGWLSELGKARDSEPAVTGLKASLMALCGDDASLALHRKALGQLKSQKKDRGTHGLRVGLEIQLRLQQASSLLYLGEVAEAIDCLAQIGQLRPYSVDSYKAYRRFLAWVAQSPEQRHQEIAELHGTLSQQWSHYSKDDIQFSFGDFDLPYQGFDRIALPGSRPAEQRIEAYQLRRHLNRLSRKHNQLTALDIGCNHGFLLLELADQLHKGFGFDISQTCIDVGNTVAQHLAIENIDLQACTFSDYIESNRGQHDLVIACAVHRWIGLPMPEFGRHLHDLVKEGGLLLVESQGVRRTNVTERDFHDKVKQIAAVGFKEVDRGSLCDDGINYREFVILTK